MVKLLVIRGPNVTADILHKVAGSMKPDDYGGVITDHGEDYYWDCYDESPVKGAP